MKKNKAKKPMTDQERDELLLLRAKDYFTNVCPFATSLYLAMKTGIDLDFIVKHKKEIGIS